MLPKRFVASVVAVQVDSVTVNVGAANWTGAACCAGVGTERDFARREATCRACGVLPERGCSGLGDLPRTEVQRPIV